MLKGCNTFLIKAYREYIAAILEVILRITIFFHELKACAKYDIQKSILEHQ